MEEGLEFGDGGTAVPVLWVCVHEEVAVCVVEAVAEYGRSERHFVVRFVRGRV